ncbi:uncharacterized protein MONBRDRAFT_12082 [Monosiga brevicollis MX1]|uniref:Uncharacterized protein n=1 Tax=Monosiga brevicollis TaxID=81824 RepID=A9VB60_MONBE|nr:uncharacterized protein MONBRDRAFT_12082 [Monosiga brevicollis MX1]EDQ85181.1 predicted protein [Monosiga brevicollis MX1]|eukprot:XP_001750006.1 hypothetical protein [Monosiga brevicollis MX1]
MARVEEVPCKQCGQIFHNRGAKEQHVARGCDYRHDRSATLRSHLQRVHEEETPPVPATRVPTNECPSAGLKQRRVRTRKRGVKLDKQQGVVGARMFMTDIGCLVTPASSGLVCTHCGHVLSGNVPQHLFKKHHVRCSQEDIDAATALLRSEQPEEPTEDVATETGPRAPVEGIPILDGVSCPVCQACFTTKNSLHFHLHNKHVGDPDINQPPRRVKLQKPLRGAGARCVEVIVEESHDASAADVSENEEELEEQQRFKQFISSTQVMASEAEEKRCPHGVHQMHPFYDSVGMTLILNELTPEQILKLGHDTPPAQLVSGMQELLWEAHEQLSQHGLAAASVASLFEAEEFQVQPQSLPQISPGTMSRYLNIGARLVHFLLLLDAMPALEPSSFLSQVLASRGEAITTAALAVQEALDAGLSGEDLVEPLATLWLALVNAELHLFDNDKVHFVNVFLLCTAVSKGSGVLQDIRRWSTTLAGLIYIFKLFLLRFGKTQRWATAGKLRPFLQSGRLVHFLSQRMAAARSASTAEGQVGVDIDVQTDGNMTDEALHTIVCQGVELNVKEIGAALAQMRNDMKEVLDTHLLLGSGLREQHIGEYARLRSKEDRTNRVKNWWVGHGSPAERALLDHIGQTPSLRQEFIQTDYGPDGVNEEPTFREDRVREWLLFVGRFNQLALTYTHMAGDEQHTFRYMDEEVSKLIFMYLLLCKPLEQMLTSWLEKRGALQTPRDGGRGTYDNDQEEEDLLEDEQDEDHMSHDDVMTLRREVQDAQRHYNNSHLLFNIAPLETMLSPASIYAAFRRQMTAYLHQPTLGVAKWRHAATFWMTTFVTNQLFADPAGTLGSLMRTQTQPSGNMAKDFFATATSNQLQAKMSSRLMHQLASQSWHAFLGLDRKRSVAELTAAKEALEARHPISWSGSSKLAADGRIIMDTQAEHDVAYMTQLAQQTRISWGHGFKSQEQLDLAAAIDQHRAEDGWLIVVAPLDMDKTLYTMPKLGCHPHAGTVLWIVPFATLADNLLRRLQAAGHSAKRWLGPSTPVAAGLDVLIITTDKFVCAGSDALHARACFQGIRTVVMDEAHTLISDASQRNMMAQVGACVASGGWTNIKRVALTDTLCMCDQERLFRQLGQQAGGKLYRLETMHHNVELRVHHGDQRAFLSHVQGLVDRQRMTWQENEERVHMMVFCDTVSEVKLLCDQLHARGYAALPYYADLEEMAQKEHLARWQQSECDVIVATSCLSIDVDLFTVRHVLWYGSGHDVYTLVQAPCDVCTNMAQEVQPSSVSQSERVAQSGETALEPVMADALPRPSAERLNAATAEPMAVPDLPTMSDPELQAQRQEEARAQPVQYSDNRQPLASGVTTASEAGSAMGDALPRPRAARLDEEAAEPIMSLPATPTASDFELEFDSLTDLQEDDAPCSSVPGLRAKTTSESEGVPRPATEAAASNEAKQTSTALLPRLGAPLPSLPVPSALPMRLPVPSASDALSPRPRANAPSAALRLTRAQALAERTAAQDSPMESSSDCDDPIYADPAAEAEATQHPCSLLGNQGSGLSGAHSTRSSAKRVASATLPPAALSSRSSEAASMPRLRSDKRAKTTRSRLIHKAAADKFLDALRLMHAYCMPCTIRQSQAVWKPQHTCPESDDTCTRCHLAGHSADECNIDFESATRECCIRCGMPSRIGGHTLKHLPGCALDKGLGRVLSSIVLLADCHPRLRQLAKRMGYNLQPGTLQTRHFRERFIAWLYMEDKHLPAGHWHLVEFVIESVEILIGAAARAVI